MEIRRANEIDSVSELYSIDVNYYSDPFDGSKPHIEILYDNVFYTELKPITDKIINAFETSFTYRTTDKSMLKKVENEMLSKLADALEKKHNNVDDMIKKILKQKEQYKEAFTTIRNKNRLEKLERILDNEKD